MTEHLVIQLDAASPDRVRWVIADSGGQRVSMTESGTYAEAAGRAQQRPVIALVPGPEVLLRQVNLPVRGAARMLQAVPFALEEQLADDVSDLHFAIGRRDAAGQVGVAAVRRALMELWLDRCDQAGLNLSHMLPETAGIPESDGLCLVIDADRVLIRDGDGRYLTGETEAASDFVAAMGVDADSDVAAHLYLSSADAARHSREISELRMLLPDVEVIEVRDDILPLKASAAVKAPYPNLLQGAYARSSNREKLWRPWRTAAILAGVFVLAALGAKSLEVMSLKSEMRQLTAELNAIAAEAMPGSRIVDPMLQLEQLATSLRGSPDSGNQEFLRMLDVLAQALRSTGGSTLGRLDYRQGTMDLTLTAPDVDTLDRISREIDGKGLSAQIQSTNPRDNGVESRIRISDKST